MYEAGSYDITCGTFTYKIYNPTTKLIPQPAFCYSPSDLPPLKGDVQESNLRQFTDYPCVGTARPESAIKKGDKGSFVQQLLWEGDVPYQYNIWWKDGCMLADNGPTSMSAADPLMKGEEAGNTKCQDVLISNWRDCNNGGVGGNLQLGCLVYEFMASGDKRVF